jgi:predicted Zn-dependent protease
MKFSIAAGVVCAAVTVAACSAVDLQNMNVNSMLGAAQSLAQATAEPSEQQEAEIGRQWAATLVGASPLLNDASRERYVNRVGRWVSLHSERPNLPWRFGILDDGDINAFSTPGGYVFVTRGLLVRLHSEAELAGVLGHEISHVVRRHQLHAMRTANGIAAGTNWLSQYIPQNGATGVISERLVSGVKEIMQRGLDKSDEYEADRDGVVLAARAGYDPYGLPGVLQMLQGVNPQDSSVALLFATHPAPGARLDALDRAMGTRFDGYAQQADNAARFQSELAPAKHRGKNAV